MTCFTWALLPLKDNLHNACIPLYGTNPTNGNQPQLFTHVEGQLFTFTKQPVYWPLYRVGVEILLPLQRIHQPLGKAANENCPDSDPQRMIPQRTLFNQAAFRTLVWTAFSKSSFPKGTRRDLRERCDPDPAPPGPARAAGPSPKPKHSFPSRTMKHLPSHQSHLQSVLLRPSPILTAISQYRMVRTHMNLCPFSCKLNHVPYILVRGGHHASEV